MKMYHLSRLGPAFFVSASIFIGSFLIMKLASRVGLGTTPSTFAHVCYMILWCGISVGILGVLFSLVVALSKILFGRNRHSANLKRDF